MSGREVRETDLRKIIRLSSQDQSILLWVGREITRGDWLFGIYVLNHFFKLKFDWMINFNLLIYKGDEDY